MLKSATFDFLAELSINNDRTWFSENKELYEEAKADVMQFTEHLIVELAKIDPLFSEETQAKKCVLRIYRDVRFSKNKLPYKNNFGIWFSASGKGGDGPGYYVHIQPGKCFFGGGYWMPGSAHLKLIRQEIDYNGEALHEVIDAPAFHKMMEFGTTEILKTSPKGYDPMHPDIAFLKLKSFEVSMSIEDKEFFDPNIVDKLVSSFKIVFPFISFLRGAIAP